MNYNISAFEATLSVALDMPVADVNGAMDVMGVAWTCYERMCEQIDAQLVLVKRANTWVAELRWLKEDGQYTIGLGASAPEALCRAVIQAVSAYAVTE